MSMIALNQSLFGLLLSSSNLSVIINQPNFIYDVVKAEFFDNQDSTINVKVLNVTSHVEDLWGTDFDLM